MTNVLPRWVVPMIGLALVALIGYLDYITGDYSILIFYLIPVAFVSWFHGRWGWTGIVVASGIARFISDVSLYRDSFLHFWNSMQDMIFLFVVGLLVSYLRKELKGGYRV